MPRGASLRSRGLAGTAPVSAGLKQLKGRLAMVGPVITRTVGASDDYAYGSFDALLAAWQKAYGEDACKRLRALDNGEGIVILSHTVIEVRATSWPALAKLAGFVVSSLDTRETVHALVLEAFNDERRP